jgi:hypothetical protein
MNDILKKFFGLIGTGAGVSIGIALLIVLIIIGPLLFMWSTNTLFGTKIAYTAWNWLVAVVFLGCVRGS